jgi:catechol 2,3-dioxygenase-like lactoylglutathione lyase family enzyme
VQNLHVRSVFFAKDAEQSLRFYTDTLGFTLDWNHRVQERAFVFQVSLLGFQLILNQAEAEARTENRPGHGRVFIGLEDAQVEAFRRHFSERRVKTTVQLWGRPTLVIRDVDKNELFFWVPESEQARLEAELVGT